MTSVLADGATSPTAEKIQLEPSVPSDKAHAGGTRSDQAGRGDAESLMSVSEQIALAEREGLNPAFYAKVLVLNAAIADTGMGRYQWELFFSSGFGWMADNLCMSSTPSLIVV